MSIDIAPTLAEGVELEGRDRLVTSFLTFFLEGGAQAVPPIRCPAGLLDAAHSAQCGSAEQSADLCPGLLHL